MKVLGDNIISSLGFTAIDNYMAVRSGVSGLCLHTCRDLPEPFMASLIDKDRLRSEFSHLLQVDAPYTDLEKAAILSVYDANSRCKVDLASPKTLFICSTTKGNVGMLEEGFSFQSNEPSSVFLWKMAGTVSRFFKNPNKPIVVSNACISGLAAIIEAKRILKTGIYHHVVVVGCDILCRFIISGFQSFKALSLKKCRPFDIGRDGLNLGEAAATMILGDSDKEEMGGVLAGAICNDACHISAPSRTGEGLFRTLSHILRGVGKKDIAFINAHGTGTLYNDDMEQNVIIRAGLENVPVNSLKPFFGHTLGAAGLVESIVSLHALNEGFVLKSPEFTQGRFNLDICRENRKTDKKYFVKMLSGFGGVNASVLFTKKEQPSAGNE
ncbi:MAG: beta-ketoacyl synthase [Bacteroides sp.]|nr:beta-ketoacyl synthase [Bacteroides sp.]